MSNLNRLWWCFLSNKVRKQVSFFIVRIRRFSKHLLDYNRIFGLVGFFWFLFPLSSLLSNSFHKMQTLLGQYLKILFWPIDRIIIITILLNCLFCLRFVDWRKPNDIGIIELRRIRHILIVRDSRLVYFEWVICWFEWVLRSRKHFSGFFKLAGLFDLEEGVESMGLSSLLI